MRTILFLILLMPFYLFAQEGKRKVEWRTLVSAGAAAGEAGAKPLAQLVGERVFGRYSTGIGLGYDGYRYNSYPVFASFRMAFDRKLLFFGYVNAGYNFGGSYEPKNEFADSHDLSGGFYGDAGIGYRFPVGGRHHLALSSGYSRKYLTYSETDGTFCGSGACPVNSYQYRYTFSRIVLKLSWEMGWR